MPAHDHLTIRDVIDHTRDDLRRVDSTAAVYILAIAGLAALVGEIGGDLPRHVLTAVSFTALPAAATIGAATAVLWPRHLAPRGVIAPGSWPHAAHEPSWKTTADAYDAHDPREYTARQLWILARIAHNKYSYLRTSSILLGVTVAGLVTAFTYALLTALI